MADSSTPVIAAWNSVSSFHYELRQKPNAKNTNLSWTIFKCIYYGPIALLNPWTTIQHDFFHLSMLFGQAENWLFCLFSISEWVIGKDKIKDKIGVNTWTTYLHCPPLYGQMDTALVKGNRGNLTQFMSSIILHV